jgi:PTH2 family peptidyl-tRNA hydrolase
MKQVIVIRKDLKMRRGKEIAQGAHASVKFISHRIQAHLKGEPLTLSDAELAWFEGNFKKICLIVNSEDELLEIHQKAQDNGLVSSLIQDRGITEFSGVPTYTCLAIGPDEPDKINQITGHLKLY